MLELLDEANQMVVRDLEFPMSRLVTVTVPNIQEYALPEIIFIKRVYVAGQLIVPTTKQVLEGHQDESYDQGLGNAVPTPTAPIAGGGGPPGNTGMYSPAWTDQAPASYPVTNVWGSPAPDAQSWFMGQRPRYYLEGGVIGLVPSPLAEYALCIDCLRVPDQIVDLNQNLVLPSNFRLALAWQMVALARFADDNDRSTAAAQAAEQKYDAEIRKLRMDQKRRDGDQPRMPKFFTMRSKYQIGNNRNTGPWPEYP
jgi:hypothetical protein